MFNLTSKKWIFFGISAVIILPGLLALLFWRLDVGLDFTGGTTVDLVFPKALSPTTSNDIKTAFTTEKNTKDTQVYYSQQTAAANTAGTVIYWVKLDTPVDTTAQKAILQQFADQNLFGTVVQKSPIQPITAADGKTTYALVPFQFTPTQKTTGGPAFTITEAQVRQALSGLKLTTGPVDLTPASLDTTPTPAATTTGTPTATATPAATATATAGSSTGTSTGASTKTPVKVLDVIAGTPDQNQIVTIQTQTQLQPKDLVAIESALITKYGAVYESQVQSVGPSIASSTTFWAVVAIFMASAAILIYIGIAFRDVGGFKQSLRYGACALFALLHDALVVLGIWAILGHFFPNAFQVDTLFVTAILTVIGFSVHDTIVVFDRIRENARRRSMESFTDIVNASLLQTMSRSLNTSLTVLITLSALTLFGGESIRSFTLALLIGIFSGTYSSIFNASMLLVVWETGEWRTLFGRRARSTALTTRGTGVARATTR
jgi:preprotein translocase SecF subunit